MTDTTTRLFFGDVVNAELDRQQPADLMWRLAEIVRDLARALDTELDERGSHLSYAYLNDGILGTADASLTMSLAGAPINGADTDGAMALYRLSTEWADYYSRPGICNEDGHSYEFCVPVRPLEPGTLMADFFPCDRYGNLHPGYMPSGCPMSLSALTKVSKT